MAAADTEKSYDIPKTHKACVYDKPGTISTKVVELDTPSPGAGEVLIRLTHSGVCHSDLGVMENRHGPLRLTRSHSFAYEDSWAVLPYPTQPGQVGGHEGVGHVVKLGPGAGKSNIKLGDRVGIKWISKPCGSCIACYEGTDGVCPKQQVSGYYYPGTFQQYAIGPANYVTPIPDALDSADAAPMLCAGVTVYAALRKSEAKGGQWVVIAGAGGGLGHLGVQIGAKGMAMRMIGIDHGSKEKLVMDCGAEAFVDITKFDDKTIGEEVKRITGGVGASAVIVCTASNRAYSQALSFLRTGGALVCVGMPEGDLVPLAAAFPSVIVTRNLKIVGSAVGNQKEAIEVLEMAARGIVKTHHKIEKMDKLTEIFKEMSELKMLGRVVLDLE